MAWSEPVRSELQMKAERAAAARHLLRQPWLTRDDDPDVFAQVVMHRGWLADQFEQFCGWPLHVDVASGTARLMKRPAGLDPSRPLRRASDGRPFDRRRLALLATVCAELISRPTQTIADLADTVEELHADPELVDFDSGRRPHRLALVDVLLWLMDLRILSDPIGELVDYVDDQLDAVLSADQTRLAMVLSTARPPARLPTGAAASTEQVVEWLTAEPRHGRWGPRGDRPVDVPAEESRPESDARNLYARHMLARRLLDDPAVELDTVHPAVARYAASPQGRRRTADIADFLDFTVEHHADVLLMIDEAGEATDSAPFDRPAAHVAQAGAAVLAGVLDGTVVTRHDAEGVVRRLLEADPGWAKGQQGRPQAFTDEVLDALAQDWLVRVDGDRVVARPAAHRLRITVRDRRETPDTRADTVARRQPAPQTLALDGLGPSPDDPDGTDDR